MVPLVALLLFGGGCDRGPVDPAPARERLQDLVFARRAGDLAAVERLVLPARRTELIETLTAIDGFVEAAERLQDYVRRTFGAALAEGVQLAALGRNLGVLSADVELLDARPLADEAGVVRVSYVAGNAPPARYARMVRSDGSWWYDPGEGFDPALPAAFRRMAEDLARFQAELEGDEALRTRIHRDAQVFQDALAERMAPGLGMLPG